MPLALWSKSSVGFFFRRCTIKSLQEGIRARCIFGQEANGNATAYVNTNKTQVGANLDDKTLT